MSQTTCPELRSKWLLLSEAPNVDAERRTCLLTQPADTNKRKLKFDSTGSQVSFCSVQCKKHVDVLVQFTVEDDDIGDLYGQGFSRSLRS